MISEQDYSYLLKRQSDPERLKRKAYEEFIAARNSGRFIAFLGSYASAHLGYDDWKRMVAAFFNEHRSSATGPGAASIFDNLSAFSNKSAYHDIDLMDLAELMANIDKHADPETFRTARESFAAAFKLQDKDKLKDHPNAAAALLRDLGITRFMTLNYDLEIEWQLFLTDQDREKLDKATFPAGSAATGRQRQGKFEKEVTVVGGASARLERVIPGRGRVVSDTVSRDNLRDLGARDNSASMIEFALASPLVQNRVLHLHGRADDASNLLITRRDYRDRYWRGGFSKLPFEYGMRLIFAGNPILFVGLGAKEDDIMRVLEQFLSDNPNRRAVPMFMIWNSSDVEGQDDARRLLFNRKFGIHILFDREIAELVGEAPNYRKDMDRYAGSDQQKQNAYRLIKPLSLLARVAESGRNVGFWRLQDFRSAQDKFDPAIRSDAVGHGTKWRDKDPHNSFRVDIWRNQRADAEDCGEPRMSLRRIGRGAGAVELLPDPDVAMPTLAQALSGGHSIKAIIGETGSGRGAISEAIAKSYEDHYRIQDAGRVVVVNGSFATDTDSIFGILSGAFDQHTAQAQGASRMQVTLDLFDQVGTDVADTPSAARDALEKINIHLRGGPLTIIINGMERFIAHDGSPLSNEVDTLVRLVIGSYRRYRISVGGSGSTTGRADEPAPPFPLTLLLIGTQRLTRYIDGIAAGSYDPLELQRRGDETVLPVGQYEYARRCTPYFSVVANALNASTKDDPVRLPSAFREKSAGRRSFFQRVFDNAFPAERGPSNPALAFQLLRTLAYIGQPTEQHVLYHVPLLIDREISDRRNRQDIDRCAKQLIQCGLVLEIGRFPGGRGPRLGLHKSLVAEIRERYGVPMSDSRLASGFNLSLFAAQPIDTYTPDRSWHDEIGKLLDFLIGSYKDEAEAPPAIAAAAHAIDDKSPELRSRVFDGVFRREVAPQDSIARLASPETADCLRAALSLLRSYYSVPALIMHSNRDLDPWMRDGPLSEHADRLTRLLRIARQVAAARRLVLTKLSDKQELGPNPFYPDDLVWMNNELAVIRLTQGSLYEARRKLQEASRLNREFVEGDDRQQNWRRIEINRLQADIDRGMIERAEDRMRDIELVVEQQARVFTPDGPPLGFPSAREYIFATYAHDEATLRQDGRPARVDPYYPTDLILTLAITQGYRGLCQHLRGALEASVISFDGALRILLHLNEQRAYAFFMRHAASAHASMGSIMDTETALKLCVAAAGHGRQTDIDHAGRISMIQYKVKERADDGSKHVPQAIPQLTETLRYAIASDMYRLQIEAMQCLAQVHLGNGDADSAFRFATDAAAIATRCGFGLRKVSLRILLGKVMAFRNDLAAARELLESASLIATKLHYEQAVESAEDERVLIGQ